MSAAKSEMMRYCAVLGCRSSAMELRAWRKAACSLHLGKTREKCNCEEPFVLFPFPAASKVRSSWLNRIGLPDLEVSDATRVCSLHFVEGKPTSRSYYPTLYLQPDISDDDEASNDSNDLHPHIESTYSCAEGFNNEETNGNDDPLKFEESSECSREEEETNEDFIMEEDSGAVDQEYSSSENSLNVQKESDNDGIIPEEAHCDDEVVLVEQKEATASVDEDVQVMYEKPKLVPLASYDPQAQVLQISNPVKYISECHNKIAQLLAEKEEMKKSYESEIERLKYLNSSLKRRFLRKPRNTMKKLKILASVSKSTLS